MKQILLNLLGNAIKFTDKGSVELLIKYQPSPPPPTRHSSSNKIVFLIKDTGRGIGQKEAAELFQPFMQADTSTTRKYGGTGLGLALSRDLAKALGGDVRLASCFEGQGCTFEATIEAGTCEGQWILHNAAELEPPALPTPPAPSTPSASELAGLKLLLAEDSVDNQLFVSRFLRKAGADVEIVNNGAEAVQAALTSAHDLILMDIQMPVLDGIAATTELRRRGYRKPIVALTAHVLADHRQRSHEAGCDAHITKPVNRDELIQTIARLTQNAPNQ